MTTTTPTDTENAKDPVTTAAYLAGVAWLESECVRIERAPEGVWAYFANPRRVSFVRSGLVAWIGEQVKKGVLTRP